MKKVIFSLFASFMLLFTLASPATACDTPDTCIQSINGFSLEVTGVGLTAGFGAVTPFGDEVAARVDKSSLLDINNNVAISGDGCPGGCEDISLSITGKAMESISTIGAAIGTTSGNTVSIENASAAQAGLGFTVINRFFEKTE